MERKTVFICNNCEMQGKEEDFKVENPSSRIIKYRCPYCKSKYILVEEYERTKEKQKKGLLLYYSSKSKRTVLSLEFWLDRRKQEVIEKERKKNVSKNL